MRTKFTKFQKSLRYMSKPTLNMTNIQKIFKKSKIFANTPKTKKRKKGKKADSKRSVQIESSFLFQKEARIFAELSFS